LILYPLNSGFPVSNLGSDFSSFSPDIPPERIFGFSNFWFLSSMARQCRARWWPMPAEGNAKSIGQNSLDSALRPLLRVTGGCSSAGESVTLGMRKTRSEHPDQDLYDPSLGSNVLFREEPDEEDEEEDDKEEEGDEEGDVDDHGDRGYSE